MDTPNTIGTMAPVAIDRLMSPPLADRFRKLILDRTGMLKGPRRRNTMARLPTPILIVTAHADAPHMDVVFEAMSAGPLDVIGKPTGPGNAEKGLESALIAKVKALSGVRPRSPANAQVPPAGPA